MRPNEEAAKSFVWIGRIDGIDGRLGHRGAIGGGAFRGYGAAPRCGAGSGPPGFGPPPRSSSPFSSSIFRTRQPSPPARDGATVTTIFVPYCSASTERFLVQPFLSNCEGLGSNSPRPVRDVSLAVGHIEKQLRVRIHVLEFGHDGLRRKLLGPVVVDVGAVVRAERWTRRPRPLLPPRSTSRDSSSASFPRQWSLFVSCPGSGPRRSGRLSGAGRIPDHTIEFDFVRRGAQIFEQRWPP